MIEIIEKTGDILRESAELAKNPAVSGVLTSLFSWLGNIFTKKSMKEKLELIEKNKHSENVIIGLKANLESLIEDNQDLKKELTERINRIEAVLKSENINISHSYKMNVIGDNNITIGENNNGHISIQK